MGILLILAQVVLVILGPVAHYVALNDWLVFLPAVLFGALWLVCVPLLGGTFVINAVNPVGSRSRR